MTQENRPQLPPNPYKRSPIKRLEDLAGRASERKHIRYYLGLTAAGQSPHLALIGQRGVGKTSLLNGAQIMGNELKLLTVRLDMNEQKAASPGRFWHDLYQALALSMVKAGCWDGPGGAIYVELLKMLHARQPGSLDKAVMQIPYVFSCHQGSIDTCECPDSLVISDLQACMEELQSQGLAGIAFMIDEADCLGSNVGLLQMFRNIFQTVEGCSLVLAGTEAVFPALSEVFSPIPRQFHRIDVKPFSRWSDTLELVLHPLPNDLHDHIAPQLNVVRDLHELCGGAPDEIQLYCHHMYRSVEDDSSARMSLSPHVFREVLREYRSSTPANVNAVLNAIERLPDKLLFESRWLSRRALTRDENIQVEILIQELGRNETLSAECKASISQELTDGYRQLFDTGISEIDNGIQLAGAPLTSGFWKSFVEVERGERWAWDDDSFVEQLRDTTIRDIAWKIDALTHIALHLGDDALQALMALRSGEPVSLVDESMAELVLTALLAITSEATHAIDVTFKFNSPAGMQLTKIRFIEKPMCIIDQTEIDGWIESHRQMLAGNGITLVLVDYRRWALPVPSELRSLGNFSKFRIPEIFGPDSWAEAITSFKSGDIQAMAEYYGRNLTKQDDPRTRNNLGFCQILLGQTEDGLGNIAKTEGGPYDPLYDLNKGVGLFLLGNCDPGRQALKNALEYIRSSKSTYDPSDVYFVLVLEPTERKVWYFHDLPVDAAILINLWRMGALTRDEMAAALAQEYPSKTPDWLMAFPDVQG